MEPKLNCRNLQSEKIDETSAVASSQSSPRKRGPQNARNTRSASSAPSHRGTPAERARERKLREDDMAIVHNPQLVQCNRCGSKIKLSLKSYYDPFHWIKHKERCLKKAEGVVREMREASELAQHKPSWSTEVKVHSSKRLAPSPSVTPPLIPDEEEEDEEEDQSTAGPSRSAEMFSGTSGSHPSLALSTACEPQDIDHESYDLDSYLCHSRRRSSHGPIAHLHKMESWQNWKCTQLQSSSLPNSQVPPQVGVGGGGGGDDGGSVLYRRNTTLTYNPYVAAVYDDERYWSPPLATLGFKESRVRLT